MKKGILLIGLLFVFGCLHAQFGTDVFTIGSDNASNYGGTWADGNNQGSGFGAWTLSSNGTAGHYIGSTGQGDPSFGIYASSGSDWAFAQRTFSNDLRKGETFSVDLGHTTTINGEIFMQLLDDGSPVFTLKFVSGGTEWQINDGLFDFGSGQSYSANNSITFSFTYNENGTYSYSFGTGSGSNYNAQNSISGINGVKFQTTNQGMNQNFGFNNLKIESKYTIPSGQSSTITSDLSVPYVEIQSGGTLVSEASNARELTISSNGNFSNSGTFTANDGQLIFSGGNSISGTLSLNDAAINGLVNLNDNCTINGSLTMNATGILDLNGYNLTIGKTGVTSAVTMDASAVFKSSIASSSLTILGDGDLGSIYFDPSNNTMGSITMSRGSGSMVIENAVSLAGSSTINNNNTLTINGDLTNSGTFTITETGALVQGPSSGLTNTGTFNVEKSGFSGASQQYNFFSSPITAGNVSSLGGNRYWFDPSAATTNLSSGWQAASGAMEVGRGYIATNSGNVTFSGTANNGTLTYSAYSAENSSNKIMNLIGNPYPSGLNLSSFMANATNNANLTGTFYFWDDDGSAGTNYAVNGYATWNGGTWTQSANSNKTGAGTAAGSAQGFIAIPKSGVATGSFNIEFTNSMREGNNSVFFKQDFQRMWVNLQDDTVFMSQTAIVLNELATNGYDETFDAPRIANANSPLINCKADTVNCAIGTYKPPFEGENTLVPLQLWVPTGKAYNLSFSEFEGLEDYQIYLVNDWEGSITPLSSNDVVEVNLQQGNNEHLYIVFKAGATVGVEELYENKLSFSSTSNQLVVFGIEENTNITILNLNGQVVKTVTTSTGIVNTADLAKGIYLARVGNSQINETIKFMQN